MRYPTVLAMPLKGDFRLRRNGGAVTLCSPGEVAEWLKAAPC